MTFALPLPPGKLTFVDNNGAPLVGGTVAFYEPGTLVAKDTWQDYGATILNANPLTLDARGQAIIWGEGRYRQIVKDSLGNTIWDEETAALTDRPYEAGFYFIDAPGANDIVGVWNFTQAVTFPTNFSDGASQISFGSVNSNPSVTTTIDIKKVSQGITSTIGAMVITDAGAVSFMTSVSNPPFAAGDRILWQVQAGGANSLSGVAATMIGALK